MQRQKEFIEKHVKSENFTSATEMIKEFTTDLSLAYVVAVKPSACL